MLVAVLNDMFQFASFIEPEYSSVELSIGRLLGGFIITMVGIKWLFDPIH